MSLKITETLDTYENYALVEETLSDGSKALNIELRVDSKVIAETADDHKTTLENWNKLTKIVWN